MAYPMKAELLCCSKPTQLHAASWPAQLLTGLLRTTGLWCIWDHEGPRHGAVLARHNN